ncbi:DgyrCDS3957 [Dimorphilus gyrociliatus]|uniref:DgyrCDS3957 n=1 Tax=Dimorphilus gyrociliatus TaxID=2664684 RepID=A0A7I8VEY3_9ANNE|nr:DgyrCDS3957 [Dimorphilus gyrociliatus]
MINTTNINIQEEEGEKELNEDPSRRKRQHPPELLANQNYGSDEVDVELKVQNRRNPSGDTELIPTTSWYAKLDSRPSHLPAGLWRVLSHLLGVVGDSKPIIGTIFHVFTVSLAILFIVLHSWFEVYNIISSETRQTTLKGFVSIFLTVYWSTLGVYSHNLAGRLLAAPAIAQSVRLHTKTVFKLNSAGVLMVLAGSGLGVNLFSSKSNRRDLEEDGRILELQKLPVKKARGAQNSSFDYVDGMRVREAFNIIDGDLDVEERTSRYQYAQLTPPISRRNRSTVSVSGPSLSQAAYSPKRKFFRGKSTNCFSSENQDGIEERSDDDRLESQEALLQCSIGNVSAAGLKRIMTSGRDSSRSNSFRRHLISDASVCTENTEASQEFIQSAIADGMISSEDLLLRHWKLSSRLRAVSICFQRWFTAWIAFIILHCGTYIIYWISHSVTLISVADFFLPILLLPLLTGAYAEVNMEGRRFIKSVCPTEGRMELMFYLLENKLEVTAFGWAIHYSTIVKALGALFIALASRLILDDMKQS